jgi:hypothetical protein
VTLKEGRMGRQEVGSFAEAFLLADLSILQCSRRPLLWLELINNYCDITKIICWGYRQGSVCGLGSFFPRTSTKLTSPGQLFPCSLNSNTAAEPKNVYHLGKYQVVMRTWRNQNPL